MLAILIGIGLYIGVSMLFLIVFYNWMKGDKTC